MNKVTVANLLTRGNLRNTADRRRILGLFLESRAWTAAELHARLDGMDLSTVYRNVNALAERGLLDTARVPGREARYELAARPHHAHRICRDCGRTDCVPCPLESTAAEHSLELYGECGGCMGPTS